MAMSNPLEAFVWGSGGAQMTPEEVARQREIAAALQAQGTDTSPVGHWTQGAARVVDALGGVLKERRADKAAGANSTANSSIIQSLLGGGASGFPAAPAGAPGGAPAMGEEYGSQRIRQAHAPTGEMAQTIRSGLIERGLPDYVADAFVMNFQDESGLNPGVNETSPTVPGSRGGFGLAQWTGPRRKALEAYAAQNGMDVADPNVQMDFLMSELQGPEARAAKSILGAQDTGGAAAAIVNQFLRPAEQHRSAREARYLRQGGQPQMAQAGGEMPLDQIPVMAGGTKGALPQGQAQQGINPAIIEALSNPAASEQTRKIAGMLLGQQMEAQQQANDPMRAMQMEKAQLELEQMRNPQPTPTDTMRNLEWRAQQAGLQPGTPEFAQFMQTGGSGPQVVNNINDGAPGLGKLSADFGYKLDPVTRQPIIDPATGLPTAAAIPGSPAALAAENALKQAEIGKTSQARSGNVVIEDIDRALSGMESGALPSAGAIGGALSKVPGTQAYDVGSLIQTVKANSGFDRLQAMRDSSPTGGALGAINESEMRLLQSALGNLEQSQSEDQLKFNLKRVRRIYDEIVNGPQGEAQLPDGVSEEDIQHTMKLHGVTREQVLERLNAN